MPKPKSIKSYTDPEFADIKQWYNEHMAPSVIDHNDQRVYENVYHQGKFPGIFQLSSKGAQKFFLQAKPRSIVDIAALTSIYRPGPLAADVDKLWLKPEKFDWGHPLPNETLKETKNLLIFQEDVMNLAHHVGGFPMEQCDEIRRAIMKRNISAGPELLAKAKKLEDDFVAGAVTKGVPESIARKIYEKILFMAGYGFNRCIIQNQEIQVIRDGTKSLIRLKDVLPGDFVYSRDEKTQKCICVKVKNVHYNGKKKLVQLRLKSGETVKCTLDHKFRVQETGEMLPLWEIVQKQLTIVVHTVKEDLAHQ
jgi:DNA polymerase-3 subunit alpha